MKPIVVRRNAVALVAVLFATLGLASFTVSAEETESKIAIPSTTDGIWKAIDQEMATLDTLITSNKLSTVHEHAYAVRDLVAALTAHPEKLSAVDQRKLATNSKFVAALAARLDQSGDSGDQAGARSNYNKLIDIVASIRPLGQNNGK